MDTAFWIVVFGIIIVVVLDPLLDFLWPPPSDVWGSKGRLIDSAKKGDTRKIRKLLAKDPSRYFIDAKDSSGMTALMHAARKGHMEVVRILLREGADPNTLNPAGATATSLAEEAGHTAIVHLLEEAGARPYEPESHSLS